METIIIIIFILGYLAITLEHNLKLDKLIPALAMMAVIWAMVSFGIDNFTSWFDSGAHALIDGFSNFTSEEKHHLLEETLLHHLGKTAEILFFLLGAMTIVEIIDYFDGFATFKNYIKTKNKKKLLWIFAALAFILSAIIDNLTATIVLITILQKIIDDRDTRLWFAGLIIIAANAGGAWSPIGDVTTTMLWIGNKVTSAKLMEYLVIPSLLCVGVPVLIASFMKPFQGDLKIVESEDANATKSKYGPTMLYLGLSAIIFVPIFKTITHLPPYVGMMLSLSVVAIFAEIYSRSQFSISSAIETEGDDSEGFHSPVHKSLSKIELPSVLFFFGILMAVAALESLGMLFIGAEHLKEIIPNTDVVIMLLGIGSAVVDNVPLVAASMGMFQEPIDSHLWHFVAYSAGTGGSMLIIGSAAGVVAMGMEKINFFWYFKNIAWLAAIGFVVGAVAFMLIRNF
ncbi:sodium:proton antiporter [Lutibacter sp. HS1-25]|uniref:sodium:proton antiporter NhaD n=1 Tax=Lutibacter sp. HS1-25 TaxID=2485000 RepID=UPI0010119D59|nr:sodium:proton antiporter NhaD [Lutibacter sp. HS1-25]RXP52645.1 sodium:proton antiporter [Lutibacter sp. HS1-25]